MPSAQRTSLASSAPPAPTEQLQDAATLPPSLRVSDQEETHYPDALPSALADRFKEAPCVMGTAVIDRHYCQCECPHLDQFVVPVVKKAKKPQPGQPSPEPTASSAPLPAPHEGESQGRLRRAVLQRGYIVFSDDYLANRGDRLVAQCQQYHSEACPCRCCQSGPAPLLTPATAPVILPESGDEVERCIDEAENYQLPLFRRKPSKLVYGEGCYVACGYNTGATEPPLCVHIPKRADGACCTPCCVDTRKVPQGGASVMRTTELPEGCDGAFESAGL